MAGVYTADISKRIKKLREKNKISQEKMAEMLGITFSNYTKIENAYQNVTIKHLKKICKIFDVPSDTILFGKVNEHTSLNFDDYIKFANIFDKETLEKTIDTAQAILELQSE